MILKNFIWIVKLALTVYNLLLTVQYAQSLKGPNHDRVVACYVMSWAAYRQGKGMFSVENMKPSLCTHLIYAYADIDDYSSTITLQDPQPELEDGRGYLRKMTDLKSKYPHLKVILAVQGWNKRRYHHYHHHNQYDYNPNAFEDSLKRKSFVDSAVEMLKNYNFDGLNLHFYNSASRLQPPQDKQNFVLLVTELKTEFNKHNMLLTASLGARKEIIDNAYDVPEISKYLDLMFIMTYGYHGAWDRQLGVNAPLYSSYETDTLNVAFTVDYMLKLGAPPNKLILGLPLFGNTFRRYENYDGLYYPPIMGNTVVQSRGFRASYTQTEGYMGYNEICSEMADENFPWNYSWDNISKTPYAYDKMKVVSYDNQRSIAEKVRYGIKKNLGGFMAWSIDTDDFFGDCSLESDAFVEFDNSRKELHKNPYFNEVLSEIKLNFSDGIPPLLKKDYTLMRTINKAIILSQQENIVREILDKFERERGRKVTSISTMTSTTSTTSTPNPISCPSCPKSPVCEKCPVPNDQVDCINTNSHDKLIDLSPSTCPPCSESTTYSHDISTENYDRTKIYAIDNDEVYKEFFTLEVTYKIHDNPATWDQARRFCRAENATLTMPKNLMEVKEILKNYNNESGVKIHVGFHDIFNEGEYVTENGDYLQFFYDVWDENQPDNTDTENCGNLNINGKLSDSSCNDRLPFICQIRLVPFRNTHNILRKCIDDSDYEFASGLNHGYKLYLSPRPWNVARSICVAEGGELAVINSVRELDFLLEMFNKTRNKIPYVKYPDNVLLGYHNLFSENHYTTVSGSDLKETGFSVREGDGKNKGNCGSLTSTGLLQMFSCSESAIFFCEISNWDDY